MLPTAGKLTQKDYTISIRAIIREMYRTRDASDLWLPGRVFSSLHALTKKPIWNPVMFKSYCLMAFRNLQKHRTYILISIFGLAVGLSAVILILSYLQFEIGYDRFHEFSDSIYRVAVRHVNKGRVENEGPVFTPPIGEDMKKDFPEVEEFVRMSTRRTAYLQVDGTAHKVNALSHASSAFFDMFSFHLISGDPQAALRDPFAIVLTQSTARRIFGGIDPLGQTIQIGPRDLYTVSGLVEDSPENSTIRFDTLVSFSTLYQLPNMHLGWNGGNQYITYIKLRKNTSPEALEAKFPEFMWTYINQRLDPSGWKIEAMLQKLKELHFHFDASSRTALANFTTFSAVAIFILLIACINFINLTTARADRRAREVGLRKVAGAHRGNLIRQFLSESVMMTALAFVVGLGLTALLSPFFSQLLGRRVDVFTDLKLTVVLGLCGLVLLVGTTSGFYPAFYLSAFQPVKTLKNLRDSGRGKKRFRNALVVVQFAISVTLIICTLLIRKQIDHIKRAELGYQKENMLIVPLNDRELGNKTEAIRTELLRIPGVLQAAASSDVPYHGFTGNGYIPEGYNQSVMFRALDVDSHFLETFGIELVAGRNFSNEFSTDREAYLINQALARQVGWGEPIGKTIRRDGDRTVIGVVKDFQFDTLHTTIAPLVITNNPWENRFEYLSIKILSDNLPKTLGAVENVYKRFSPVLPFEPFFLDDAFNRIYRTEERFQAIFLYFSGLAISLALLGLFSLSAYSARQKAKEIGIRKVLGATTSGIVALFSKEMIGLILAANAIAWAAAFFIIRHWLENFASRTSIGIRAFLLAFLGSLVAALATISFQSVKAAMRNPVDELHSE